MKTSIKLLLSAAVLAASTTAFGQTVINGTLDASSPTFTVFYPFTNSSNCVVNDEVIAPYAVYSTMHSGGTLDIELDSDVFDAYLGLYEGSFDPLNPCINVIEFNDDGGIGGYLPPYNRNSRISRNLDAGTYTIVATKYFTNGGLGNYTLRSNTDSLINITPQRPAAAPVSVPVAGIPALALGSLALIGAAGFVSRRRKAKAEKA